MSPPVISRPSSRSERLLRSALLRDDSAQQRTPPRSAKHDCENCDCHFAFFPHHHDEADDHGFFLQAPIAASPSSSRLPPSPPSPRSTSPSPSSRPRAAHRYSHSMTSTLSAPPTPRRASHPPLYPSPSSAHSHLNGYTIPHSHAPTTPTRTRHARAASYSDAVTPPLTPHEAVLRARLERVLLRAAAEEEKEKQLEKGQRMERVREVEREMEKEKELEQKQERERGRGALWNDQSPSPSPSPNRGHQHRRRPQPLLTPPPTPPHISTLLHTRSLSLSPTSSASSLPQVPPASPPSGSYASLPSSGADAQSFSMHQQQHQNVHSYTATLPPQTPQKSEKYLLSPYLSRPARSSTLASVHAQAPAPAFDARRASAECARIAGYVSFVDVAGLGVPPGLDECVEEAGVGAAGSGAGGFWRWLRPHGLGVGMGVQVEEA